MFEANATMAVYRPEVIRRRPSNMLVARAAQRPQDTHEVSHRFRPRRYPRRKQIRHRRGDVGAAGPLLARRAGRGHFGRCVSAVRSAVRRQSARRAADLSRLSLLPTCGTRFYRYDGGWKLLYAEDFSPEQKQKIIAALNQAVNESGYQGGQDVGRGDRRPRKPDHVLGLRSASAVRREESLGSRFFQAQEDQRASSIRCCRISRSTSAVRPRSTSPSPASTKPTASASCATSSTMPIEQMLYVGDALFPGGNDYPVRSTGATCIQVRDPNESKRVIETVIACLSGP